MPCTALAHNLAPIGIDRDVRIMPELTYLSVSLVPVGIGPDPVEMGRTLPHHIIPKYTFPVICNVVISSMCNKNYTRRDRAADLSCTSLSARKTPRLCGQCLFMKYLAAENPYSLSTSATSFSET